MSEAPASDGTRRAAEIAENVLVIRRCPARREELVGLLAEQSPIYRSLSTGDAERIRGFILASFETIGLPEAALPFVLEELEIGINPYTVAAAAKALRGTPRLSKRAMDLLVVAAERIASNDDNVQYDTIDIGDRVTRRTSAREEILRTIALSDLQSLPLPLPAARGGARDMVSAAAPRASSDAGPSASGQPDEGCCCATVRPSPARTNGDIKDLVLQDQGGRIFTYRDFFDGRPSVVAFFYTRCMNPQKCSLTISKLAALQRQLGGSTYRTTINVGAFTYDPAYDRADRLRRYGAERGFRFDERNRFIRTVGSFEPIQANFDLNVGFGSSTVNRHSVELLILGTNGALVQEFRRVQWSESEIVGVLQEIVGSADQDDQ